jgi:hypothetical protein
MHLQAVTAEFSNGEGRCSFTGIKLPSWLVTTPTPTVQVSVVTVVNPTSMVAGSGSQLLSIFGTLAIGNAVQLRCGAGSGAGVWATSPATPNIHTNRMTITTNRGSVADIGCWRVCGSTCATTTADCSSGTASVTVLHYKTEKQAFKAPTEPAPPPRRRYANAHSASQSWLRLCLIFAPPSAGLNRRAPGR